MRDGFRFECQPGCTACCELKGFVYLTEDDILRAAQFLGMTVLEFERQYVYRTRNRRRLRTPRNSPCRFLGVGGCSIHPAKPTQCRIFPFWPELVENEREWQKSKRFCPGLDQGQLIQIEAAREQAGEMRMGYPEMYE